jgi:hypothetical protein
MTLQQTPELDEARALRLRTGRRLLTRRIAKVSALLRRVPVVVRCDSPGWITGALTSCRKQVGSVDDGMVHCVSFPGVEDRSVVQIVSAPLTTSAPPSPDDTTSKIVRRWSRVQRWSTATAARARSGATMQTASAQSGIANQIVL